MKFYLSLIMAVGAVFGMTSKPVSGTYSNRPLSDVLVDIERQAKGDVTINFAYEKLEDYPITSSFNDIEPWGAVLKVIGFYPVKATLQDKIITVQPRYDSLVRITGRLIDERENPLQWANVAVYADSDSVPLMCGVTDESGRFVLPLVNAHSFPMQIKARCLSHNEMRRTITNSDAGTIIVPSTSLKLNEVIVEAPHVVMKDTGLSYTLSNLRGTYIGDAGSVRDMLGWCPGLMLDASDNIKLVNGSSPVIYIDNRRIVSQSELTVLRSEDVQKIEVIREPGARYGSGTEAVIRITLYKHLRDYLGINVSDKVTLSRKPHDQANINLIGKYKRLQISAGLTYEFNSTRGYQDKGMTVAATDSYPIFSDSIRTTFGNHNNQLFGRLGLNFTVNDKSYLALTYFGGMRHIDSYKENRYRIHDGEEYSSYTENSKTPHNKTSNHSVTAGYYLIRNASSQLNLTVQYNTSFSRFGETLTSCHIQGENLNLPQDTYSYTDNAYSVANFEGDYSFSSNGNNLQMGVSTDYIHNKSNYTLAADFQQSKRNDLIQAGFLTWRRNLSKNVTLTIEARYEYSHTKIEKAADSSSQTYNDLCPFAHIYWKPSKSWFVLYFRRGINHPTISQLNTIVRYSDLFHYSTGNPDLRSATNNQITAAWGLGAFTMMLSYVNAKNFIMDDCMFEIASGQRAWLTRPTNAKSMNTLSLKPEWKKSTNRLTLSACPSVGYTMLDYNKEDGLLTPDLRKWHFNFNLNGSYKLHKQWELFTTFAYSTPYYMCNIYTGDMWNWDLGIKARLCKTRMIVTLQGNDLLHRGVTPKWTRRFANVSEWSRNSYDTRKVSLQVQYIFNTIRSNYRSKSIGQSATQRAR